MLHYSYACHDILLLKQEALDAANQRMTAGDYAGAAQVLQGKSCLLHAMQEDNPLLAVYLLQTARCYQHLGMLKKVRVRLFCTYLGHLWVVIYFKCSRV